MTRYKLLNGERIQFTAEEEAQRDAEETAWNAEKTAWDNDAFNRAMLYLRQKSPRD